jgi:16S rRNA (uracil1498-N3)-methyltransferase
LADDKYQARRTRTARFYHADELHSESELTLSKSASHHLITVLRTRKNDILELFNGDGYNYRATVVDTGQRTPAKCALLQVHERCAVLNESPLSITLVQAISRADRMDITLRQAVELGVQHIQPVYSRHSAKPLDEKRAQKKQDHWQSIVISACEQCGRAVLPTLAPAVTLKHWLYSRQTDNEERTDYLLAPTATQSLLSHVSNRVLANTPVGLLIGPESGFDDDEIMDAQNAGTQAVRFGPRILRTETAGPAAITLLQSSLGDLGHDKK